MDPEAGATRANATAASNVAAPARNHCCYVPDLLVQTRRYTTPPSRPPFFHQGPRVAERFFCPPRGSRARVGTMGALGRVNARLIPGCVGAGEGHDVPASGLRVGRDVDCHVRIDLPFVSLRHCRISLDENDQCALEDTRSNHTCVNGRILSRNEIVLLKDFDAIRLTKRSLPELCFLQYVSFMTPPRASN